tara:strand:- start:33 stop:689 length:657 start_codon:yes stop_codon:yes gene_type:complete
MKKIIAIFLSLSFLSIQSLKAETMGVGITGAFHMLDVSGTETTRSSGEKNNGSHEEDVLVPEIFVEAILDNGAAIGLSYIPTRDMGSKSRSDTNSEGDTGSYKAEAELDNVVQIYADIPFGDVAGYNVYGKVGIQHATVVTLESLNSGSTYPDVDVYGYTVGLGTKGDLPLGNNLYYKAEVTYTDFEDFNADSNSSPANKVNAELEDLAAKLSIGYKF